MPLPRIAIVGRPNVGKSSLLNLIAHERVAIVDSAPGVTRDRVSAIVELASPDLEAPPREVELIDTGGFGVYTAEGARYNDIGADLATLTDDIERQIASAVESADLILFAVDAQSGITPHDETIAQMLRSRELARGDARIVVVATKVDDSGWEPHAYELSALGFGEPLMVSSKSKYMRRDFLDALWGITPERDDGPEAPADMKVAIVGKRNTGKSTLINALAGEDRVIVSEIAGTTRDAVDVRIETPGRTIVAIDTAGLRRRKSFQDKIEAYALDRARRAIARADVILFMLDATTEISQVDEQLGKLVVDSHKPVVIVLNKWDLAEGRADASGRAATPERFEHYIRRELKGLAFSPIAIMSAEQGMNVSETLEAAWDLYQQASTRVGTGELNRIIRSILESRGPSNKLGAEARVFFASQVRTNPPTIVLVVNDPDRFTNNYERFLMNQLREALPYDEVPIRLILRARSRVERRDRSKRGRELHAPDPVTGRFDDDLSPENIDRDAMLRDLPDDAGAYFDD